MIIANIIVVNISIVIIYWLSIMSASISQLLVSAQTTTTPTTILCGTHDTLVHDPTQILRVVSSSNSSTLTSPCPLLEIRNKNIRQLTFDGVYVQNLVVRDCHFQDVLDISSESPLKKIMMSKLDYNKSISYSNSINKSFIPPYTITIDNVTFEWYKRGQPVDEAITLLLIKFQTVDRISISNSKFFVDVNYNPTDVTGVASEALFVDSSSVAESLLVENNYVETTSCALYFQYNLLSGAFRISNNTILYRDKYETTVDDKYGSFSYSRNHDDLLRVTLSASAPEKVDTDHHNHHLDIFVIGNTFHRVMRFHLRYGSSSLLTFMGTGPRGNIFEISENIFVIDGDQLSLIPRSEEAQKQYGSLVTGRFSMAGIGLTIEVPKVLVRRNRFQALKYGHVTAVGCSLTLITGENNSSSSTTTDNTLLEISENTMNYSSRTTKAVTADWKGFATDETAVLFPTLNDMKLISVYLFRCRGLNILHNVAEHYDFYQPLVYAPFSIDMLRRVDIPSMMVKFIELVNHPFTEELLFEGNRANMIVSTDSSIVTRSSIVVLRRSSTTIGFSGARKLRIVGNVFEFIEKSSISILIGFVAEEGLTMLDTLDFEGNTLNTSLLSPISPCSFCASPETQNIVNLLGLVDAAQALLLEDLLRFFDQPFSNFATIPASGRDSPLHHLQTTSSSSSSSFSSSSSPQSLTIRSNVFTAAMPSSSISETNKFDIVLFNVARFNETIDERSNINNNNKRRAKSILVENNTLNIVSSPPRPRDANSQQQQQQETNNFFCPSTILNVIVATRLESLRILNNKHFFINTESGVAATFRFSNSISLVEGTAPSSSSSSSFEIRGNQLKRIRNNNNMDIIINPIVPASYYRNIGFEQAEIAVVSIWKLISPLSSEAPTSVMISISDLIADDRDDSSSSSSPLSSRLVIANNEIDTSEANTSETNQVFLVFNNSDLSVFAEVLISNNIVKHQQKKSWSCAFVSGSFQNSKKAAKKITIENNAIDFSGCASAKSMLNLTGFTVGGGGEVAMWNNEMNCGEGDNRRGDSSCFFASIIIDDERQEEAPAAKATSSSLQMKANQITISNNNKQSECDDEEKFFKFHQYYSSDDDDDSSSPSFRIDVSSDSFATNCNEIVVYDEETNDENGETTTTEHNNILNVSGLKSKSSIISLNDTNCQVLTKCKDDDNRRNSQNSSTTTSLSEAPLPNDVASSSSSLLIISEEVSAAITANNVIQSSSIATMSIGAAAAPALAFAIGRQTAMSNYAQNALSGDCRGLLPSMKTRRSDGGEENNHDEDELLDSPLSAADSPTRMQIGDASSVSSLYVGSCVGNFLLFCGLVLLNQLIGHLVTWIITQKYLIVDDDKTKNGNSSNRKLFLALYTSKEKQREYEMQTSRWKSFSYVFANSFVSLSFFFLVALLLSPTLTSAVVVTAGVSNDVVPVGMKILCLILALIMAAGGVYYIVWSVYLRKPRREKYCITNKEEETKRNKKKQIGIVDAFKYLCKADGEWKIPINKRTEKETNEFQISDPCYTSYRRNQWFAVVEIITTIVLCLPPLFAQFASSGKSSCIIQGSLLFFILLVYTILLIWKNPKKLRSTRIIAPALAIQQTLTVGMTLITVVMREDENNRTNSNQNRENSEEDSWIWKVIFIPMGIEVVAGVFSLIATIFPFLLFLRKLRSRIKKMKNNNKNDNNNSFRAEVELPTAIRPRVRREGAINDDDYLDDNDDREMFVMRNNHNNNFRLRRSSRDEDNLHREDRRRRNSKEGSRERERDHHHHHHRHHYDDSRRRHSSNNDRERSSYDDRRRSSGSGDRHTPRSANNTSFRVNSRDTSSRSNHRPPLSPTLSAASGSSMMMAMQRTNSGRSENNNRSFDDDHHYHRRRSEEREDHHHGHHHRDRRRSSGHHNKHRDSIDSPKAKNPNNHLSSFDWHRGEHDDDDDDHHRPFLRREYSGRGRDDRDHRHHRHRRYHHQNQDDNHEDRSRRRRSGDDRQEENRSHHNRHHHHHHHQSSNRRESSSKQQQHPHGDLL